MKRINLGLYSDEVLESSKDTPPIEQVSIHLLLLERILQWKVFYEDLRKSRLNSQMRFTTTDIALALSEK